MNLPGWIEAPIIAYSGPGRNASAYRGEDHRSLQAAKGGRMGLDFSSFVGHFSHQVAFVQQALELAHIRLKAGLEIVSSVGHFEPLDHRVGALSQFLVELLVRI